MKATEFIKIMKAYEIAAKAIVNNHANGTITANEATAQLEVLTIPEDATDKQRETLTTYINNVRKAIAETGTDTKDTKAEDTDTDNKATAAPTAKAQALKDDADAALTATPTATKADGSADDLKTALNALKTGRAKVERISTAMSKFVNHPKATDADKALLMPYSVQLVTLIESYKVAIDATEAAKEAAEAAEAAAKIAAKQESQTRKDKITAQRDAAREYDAEGRTMTGYILSLLSNYKSYCANDGGRINGHAATILTNLCAALKIELTDEISVKATCRAILKAIKNAYPYKYADGTYCRLAQRGNGKNLLISINGVSKAKDVKAVEAVPATPREVCNVIYSIYIDGAQVMHQTFKAHERCEETGEVIVYHYFWPAEMTKGAKCWYYNACTDANDADTITINQQEAAKALDRLKVKANDSGYDLTAKADTATATAEAEAV